MAENDSIEKKPRRERGTGRLWQIGRIWYIKYYVNGQQRQESTRSTSETFAKKLLQKRLGEAAAGIHRELRTLKYEGLRAAYLADYVAKKHKSLRWRKDEKTGEMVPWLDKVDRLEGFFAGYRASAIDADLMREFIAKLQAEGKQDSTINRSLSALRRMFNLAKKDKKLREVPHFPMLKEPPARAGFFEHAKYAALSAALPDYLRPVLALGYHTGMRRNEICTLRWGQVDFLGGVIRLNAGETKNDEGRTIPIVGELGAVLRAEYGKRRGDLVCFRVDRAGKTVPIGDFRKVWQDRCVKLGLGQMAGEKYTGLIFHDLRRTAVRNLVRAGVPESVAMKITGHKTRSVFDRYDITSERDVRDARTKLETYLAGQFGEKTGKTAEPSLSENSVTPLPS